MRLEEGEVICWSRMQAEAGQPLQDIIARKDIERRAGNGLFCWGVGNAPGVTAAKLYAAGLKPDVIFSIMKSRPKAVDLRPAAVVAWRGYIAVGGQIRPLPTNCLVTSRVRGDGHELPARHYALICRSEQELALSDYGSFEPSNYRNLGGTGAPIGSSQVTALLRRAAGAGSGSGYRVNIRAKLDLHLWVRLADPVKLRSCHVNALSSVDKYVSDKEWVDLVTWLRKEPSRRSASTALQPALL